MTRTFGTPADNSTNANFRAWGQFLSQSMAAIGWVQTADTGQINWTTVLSPSSPGTYPGYEMWRPGDGLTPYYLKIEYGAGPSSFAQPAVRVSFGTTTNGAGTLAGVASSAVVVNTTSGMSATTNYDCLIAGGPSWMSLCFFRMTSTPMVFAIERSKDLAGNDSDEFMIHFIPNSTASRQCLITKTVNKFYEDGLISGIYIPNGITSTLYQGKVAVLPIQPVIGYQHPPQLVILSMKAADFTDDEIIPVTLYTGVTHNYRVIKASSTNGFGTVGGTTNCAAAIRWD